MNLPASIKIEELLDIRSSSPRPGCAVAVLKDGVPIFQKCYGLANMEDGVAISPQTIFNIGSISKQFTAFAIGLLEQEGKLSLEDDIHKYLPEMPDYGCSLRIRHLLYHTSGVRNSYPDLLWLGEWRDGDITTTEDARKLIFAQRNLNFMTGKEFQYSNSNYVLLAEICARVSGMPFGKFCKERIFEPLAMRSSVIHDSCFMLIPKRALGYFSDDKGSWFLAPLNDSVVGPTNVYTNIPDLAKWDENFYTGRIGSLDLVRRMCQPGSLDDGTPLEYGWGFDVGEAFVHRGWRTVEHSGSQGGYTSHMLRIPELHMSVIFMSNFFNMLATEMAWKVADLFLEQKTGTSSIPSKAKKADLSLEPIPTTWAGMYFAPERDALREVKIKRGILYYEGRELVRISQHGFSILHDESAHIEIQDGLGGIPTLDVIIPNGKFHYEKVMIVKKSKVEPSQYTGRYYSPELDVYWIVDTDESSSLVIKRRKYPSTHLTPVFEDAFRDDWQPIVDFPYKFLLIFTRNAQKEVTELRVSGAGPRRLRFEKC